MSEIKYTNKELMACVCSHEIKNGEVCIVGIGLPMMGALLASKTHAADTVFVYESGGVGAVSRRVPWTVGDTPAGENATCVMEMWRMLSDQQAGFIDRGLIGGAQIDLYGNVNSTVIIGDRSYEWPRAKLPGSGGGNDIGASCGETTIIMQLKPGKFVKQCDYITTVGHLTGPGSREALGLPGGGPSGVLTEKCIFRFDKDTKEMYLDTVFPGVTVEEIKEMVEWDLKISDHLKQVTLPTQEEIDLIHKLDPKGILLGSRPVLDSFEGFAEMYENSYRSVQITL